MTTPHERTRAMIWAGGFLIEISLNKDLPLEMRRAATVIARHYPTTSDIRMLASLSSAAGFGDWLVHPRDVPSASEECGHGPLTSSTSLPWPE